MLVVAAVRATLGGVVGVAEVEEEDAGPLEDAPGGGEHLAQGGDVAGDGRLVAELAGDAVVALPVVGRAGDDAGDGPGGEGGEAVTGVALNNGPWDMFLGTGEADGHARGLRPQQGAERVGRPVESRRVHDDSLRSCWAKARV